MEKFTDNYEPSQGDFMADKEEFEMDAETVQVFKAMDEGMQYIRAVQDALAIVAGHILLTHQEELGELYVELRERLVDDTEAGCIMEWFEETLGRLNYADYADTITAIEHLLESVSGG